MCAFQLPLEVVQPLEPGEGPTAVREARRGRHTLVCVNDVARRAGIRVGMSEAEARAGCASLKTFERDSGLELERLQQTAERLFAYGPEVEVSPPAMAFVEVGAGLDALRHRFGLKAERDLLEHLVGDLEGMGHRVTAAIADDPETARTFAEHLASERSRGLRGSAGTEASPRFEIVPPGRSRAMLARLPLEALAWTDRREDPEGALRSRLSAVIAAARGVGLETVGQLASAPATELGARFGEAGVRLAKRACGTSRRPLRTYIPPEQIEERFEFDAVTEDLEPVLFVLRRLLHRLTSRLEARQLAAGLLILEWWVEPGLERRIELDGPREARSKRTERMELRLARPTRVAETLFAVARERIGGALPGAVWSLRVLAERAEAARGTQLDLFSRRPQRTEAFGELVGRLDAALGDGAVFGVTLEDTHRPEGAWSAQPFSVERALAPRAEPKRTRAQRLAAVVVANQVGSSKPLPSVDAGLSVVGADVAVEPESVEALPSWPRARARRPEDEVPPPLPTRPLELLDPPEPARIEGERLLWRGARLAIERRSNPEHLATEWWRADGALERNYLRIDTAEGRGLWVFTDRQGRLFVHGLFD